MKVVVTTVQEIEVEINYPAYRKTSAHYYKVLDEKKAVCVTMTEFCQSIEVVDSGTAFNRPSVVDSTETEFTAAFNKVNDKIIKLIKAA